MSLWWALGSLSGLDGGRRGDEGRGHGLARATGHAGKGAKCGARGNRIDVRPHWKEAPGTIDGSGRPAMPGGED